MEAAKATEAIVVEEGVPLPKHEEKARTADRTDHVEQKHLLAKIDAMQTCPQCGTKFRPHETDHRFEGTIDAFKCPHCFYGFRGIPSTYSKRIRPSYRPTGAIGMPIIPIVSAEAKARQERIQSVKPRIVA